MDRIPAIRRLGSPALANLGLPLFAANLLSPPVRSTAWLVSSVALFIISAADAAWDIVARVGLDRRARNAREVRSTPLPIDSGHRGRPAPDERRHSNCVE